MESGFEDAPQQAQASGRGNMNATDDRAATPALSVVIATRNRSQLLRAALGSLETQTAATHDYEVVVVVDGSSDDTLIVLEALTPRYALTVLESDSLGASGARNAGAGRAAGRILLFLDDDEEAEPGLVSAHLEAHGSGEPIVGCGAITRRVPPGADRFARLQADEGNERIAELAARPLTYWDCCGGNMSLPREAFDKAGGFATDLPRENDTEFAYRLHTMGLRMVFVAAGGVCELRTRPWDEMLKDAELRGRIAVELYERHPPMLAAMPLGRYGELPRTPAGHLIVMFALGLRLPPRLLGLAGFTLPRASWTRVWLFSIMLVHAYWRGVRSAASHELWKKLRSSVVILGYHAFGEDTEKPSRYVVPGRRFARQLEWLRRRRYNLISLGEYAEYRSRFELPPPRTVVVTIDDAYRDSVTLAAPQLERHGITATVFVISRDPGPDDLRTDPALVARPRIAADQMQLLLDGPFEIGAHTQTHTDLTRISAEEAESQIVGSKRDLEQASGAAITLLAYPFGASSPTVQMLAERAGYHAARGARPGRNRAATNSFDLRRTEVPGTHRLWRFAASLLLGDLRN